jgi:hypothetical protein
MFFENVMAYFSRLTFSDRYSRIKGPLRLGRAPRGHTRRAVRLLGASDARWHLGSPNPRKRTGAATARRAGACCPKLVGLVRLHYGTMFSMSTRLVNLIRRVFILLAFARPRAAGIMLSSRA